MRVCRQGHDDWHTEPNGASRYCRTCRNDRRRARRLGKPIVHTPPKEPVRKPLNTISNEPLREHVREALRRDPDLSIGMIADRMGWLVPSARGYRIPDERRLTRALGLRSYRCSRRDVRVTQREITEDVAVEIGRAIHLDPWELGI